MCLECLLEHRPDRGRTCLEEGVYMINFKGCKKCGEVVELKNKKVEATEEEEVEDGEFTEELTFDHVCGKCGHVVAQHFYQFQVTPTKQEFMMECMLCGRGIDEIPLGVKRETVGTQTITVAAPKPALKLELAKLGLQQKEQKPSEHKDEDWD